jgi:HAD superfamily hydrolase (TIGR01509 family)
VFQAVIFDWDGTLADTWDAVLASFHGALTEVAGIDVPNDFIERRIGVGAAWTFKEILQAKGMSVDSSMIRRLVEVKIRVAIENTSKVKLFPGARELLEALNGKVKMGLASMNNRAIIDRLLPSLDVAQFFNTTLAVDEVEKTKPNPEIFLKTAQKLGIDPDNCVVLEDSIFGVKAAKAAKMDCIGVTQGAYNARELAAANADFIVASLKEKEKIVNYIIG